MVENPITRRTALAALLAPAAIPPDRFATPYKYGKLVLAASPEQDGFDSRTVDCPFPFEHAGLFYMTYVAYDGTGYQTGLASSHDLISWKKLGCILRRDPASEVTRYNVAMNWILRDNAMRSEGSLKKVLGQFLGVYHAYPNAGLENGPAVIGLCRSSDLMHWKIDPPCLKPDDGAEWERGGLYKPCLVEHRGTFYIFYNAKTTEKRWHEQTGVAMSHDLTTWTRYEGNPLIHNGAAGAPDERFASDPCVLQDGATWALFYFGLDTKGKARDLLATGPDLLHFNKSDGILIDTGEPGSVDETYAHKPGVIWHEGALYHFYCAVSGKWPNEIRGISVARSRAWSAT